MKEIINVHVDDYGLGTEISNNIIESINNGIVNSVSIICNTKDFIDSIEKIKQSTSGVRVSLHLNLVEGTPLTPESKVNMLVNKVGEFRYSFISLWLKYILSSKKKKNEIRDQIRIEIEHQIEKYSEYCMGSSPLRLDSHMHLHMIPFIFDIIIELSEHYRINFIRIPYELKYFNIRKFYNLLSANFIKNCLLNYLSKLNSAKLNRYKINRNDYFIGVLASGNMTIDDVDLALKMISNRTKPKSVDILFHPGGVENKKSINWTKNNIFQSYYSSDDRERERNILKSEKLKNIIDYYETIFSN